jgi:hypothetical protein
MNIDTASNLDKIENIGSKISRSLVSGIRSINPTAVDLAEAILMADNAGLSCTIDWIIIKYYSILCQLTELFLLWWTGVVNRPVEILNLFLIL